MMPETDHELLEELRKDVNLIKSFMDQIMGARKFWAWLSATFGALVVASLIAAFSWVWAANVTAQVQEERLQRVTTMAEDAVERVQTNTRSLAVSSQQNLEVMRRLDQVEESNQQILLELRRRR